MACFITPLIVGIAIAISSRLWKNSSKIKLGTLAYLLIGGALILAIEHLWHGEISPYPPFLTVAKNIEDIHIVIHEISVIGSSMTLATVALWLGILYTSKRILIKTTSPIKTTTTLGT